MICTALAVAFLVYPTVLALSEAIVRPQPVPAAPMSESNWVSKAICQNTSNGLTAKEKYPSIVLRSHEHEHPTDKR